MRLATPADVVHIGETMWARGREELKHLGIDKLEWFSGWMRRIDRGEAIAFGPHAILGCDPDVEGVATAFQASSSFEEPGIGRQVTKEMRRCIPLLMEGRGIRLASVYSLCIDPGAPKWFRLLGFVEDEQFRGVVRGPYVMRRFTRRI